MQHSQLSEYSAVLTPNERSQFRIAGQPFDRSPPAKPFPHASRSKVDDTLDTKHHITHRLADLDPPIYATSPDSHNLPLHQQHRGALTALLHKALFEGDFSRAGRAFGLILRDGAGGQLRDIRAEGRWGVGAEILLRREVGIGHQKEELSAGRENEADSLSKSEQDAASWFTRKGFEDAKKYYERLIVQFPFHKPNAGAVNALDFYPAMFGLWIYVVQEEGKLDQESLDESTLSETSHADGSTRGETTAPFNLASKQRTLAQAREIAIRMDNCMTTIPYSDHVELIRLRGMVAQWMADVIDDILLRKQNHGVGENEEEMIQADDVSEALRLEADGARKVSLEMQRKMQEQREGLG